MALSETEILNGLLFDINQLYLTSKERGVFLSSISKQVTEEKRLQKKGIVRKQRSTWMAKVRK